jgi:hypothetical protein
MAEIPKFTGNPVYNEPIGVVTPMRDTSGETLANIGQKLFEYDYAKKYAAEELKGTQFGKTAAFGKDVDGNVTPVEIPENFSKVARQNAVPEADKRFIERLTLDAQKHASVLHAQHDQTKDYKAFGDKWKAYSEETLKRLGSDPSLAKYQSVLAQAMDAEGFTHGSKLYADRLGVEHKAAFVNRVQILESAISNQRAMVGLQSKDYESGDVVGDDADYNKNNILEIIDGLVEDFPTLAEREMMQKLKDDVKQNHFLGKLDNVASALIQNIGDNYNQYTQDIPIGNIMQSAQTAIRTGNMDNITNPVHRRMLEAVGLDKVIASDGFGDVQDKLASSFDSVENNIVAQTKANKDSLLRSAYSRMAVSGAPLSANAGDHILKTGKYAIGTPQDLLNNLGAILTGDRNAPEYAVLMGNGQLPKSVTDALAPDMIEGWLAQNSDNPMASVMLRNFVKQSTQRMRGGRLVYNSRGIPDDTIMFFETLDAVANTTLFKDFTPADIMAKRAERERDPLAQETVKKRMAEHFGDAGKNPTTLDFVRDATGSTDAAVNLHFARYSDDLVYTFGAARAAEIIGNSVDKVFQKSDYMALEGGQRTYTRFAPEQHYNRDGEMDIILGAAQTALKQSSTGKTLKMGSTAFFAPTTGTRPIKGVPTNLPSYRIVDRNNKVILDNNMKPIVVTPQVVLQARGAITQEQIKAELEAANASRAAYLTGTNQLGQKKIRSSGGKASSISNVSRSINQLLDAQRERARKLAGQK